MIGQRDLAQAGGFAHGEMLGKSTEDTDLLSGMGRCFFCDFCLLIEFSGYNYMYNIYCTRK